MQRLVCPFIGYSLLGVHPSMSVVRRVVIGYHCNCLDGQLNYWTTTHQLIGVLLMCGQWMCSSTLAKITLSSPTVLTQGELQDSS